MLQTNQEATAVYTEPNVVSAAETFNSFVSFMRRRYPVIVVVAILGLALGLAYLISTPPSYTAQTLILIDARKNQLFQQQSILGDIPIDTGVVESQIEVLKSENVARAVIQKFRLDQDLEFVGSAGGLLGIFGQFDFQFYIRYAGFGLRTQPAGDAGVSGPAGG